MEKFNDIDLNAIQSSLNYIYESSTLSEDDSLFTIQQKIQSYYKKKVENFENYVNDYLLVNSTLILLKNLSNVKGDEILLNKLTELWNSFYSNIIPLVQAVFLGIKFKSNVSIRTFCLASFRDCIVLNKNVSDTIAQYASKFDNYPSLRQMILVLLTHCESSPPKENYMKLEKLVDDLKLLKNFYYNSRICFAQLNLEQNEKS